MKIKVENHLGLVKSIASKFVQKGYEFDELYGIGCLALVEASRTYDSQKGSFSTWATKLIRQSFLNNFRKNKLNFVDSKQDLNEVVDLRNKIPFDFVSVLLEEEESDSYNEKQDKKILVEHFINKKSWAEIGRKLNLSRERIRQKGNDAINRLRQKYRLVLEDFEFFYL